MVTAGVVAVALAALAIYGWSHHWRGSQLIDIDRADPTTIEFAVDVNSADWPELTLLPNVGETLARRIVENRQQHGPFADVHDLQRVKGIGPRTVEQMRPYLLPLPDREAIAGAAVGEPNS
jgi:competence protein ComEA